MAFIKRKILGFMIDVDLLNNLFMRFHEIRTIDSRYERYFKDKTTSMNFIIRVFMDNQEWFLKQIDKMEEEYGK